MKTIIGKSYLIKIPHEGGKLIFKYPGFMKNSCNLAEKIDKEGLKRPNSSETASLVHNSWKNPKEKYSSEIINLLTYSAVLEFTGNLYLKKSKLNKEINNGVILDLNSQALKFDEDRKLIMDKNSLIKRLELNDPLVKFVPFGTYKIGEQTIKELEKNKYVVARYGEEGAEKIAEIASNYKEKFFVDNFIFRKGEEIARMSCLDGYFSFDDRLIIGYDYYANNYRALGICKK